jgi:hypothetical protein
MKVFLFYLSDAKYGGWPTFTCHLALALRSLNMKPIIVKLAKRSYAKPRSFGRSASVYYVSLKDAVSWAKQAPSIVTVASPKMSAEANALVGAGCRIAMHDPTELKGGHHDNTIKASRHPIISTSRVLEPLIAERGGESVFLLHPYTSVGVGVGHDVTAERPNHATCVSRVDFDKNTDMVIAANWLLPTEKRIAIYGGLNRLYAFHKLDTSYPNWKQDYRGEFNADNLWAGSFISREGKYAVDMSTIVGDGGRTQYTFLEAWDGGATLVLNRHWLTGDNDIDEVRRASLFVDDASQLALTLQEDKAPDPSLARNAKRILERHSPDRLSESVRGLVT